MTNIPISNSCLRNAIYGAFEGKCFYTGQPIEKKKMAIDHVLPKNKGGEDNVYNYVLTSKRLNTLKSTKFYKEKLDAILFIVATVYAPKVLMILNRYDEKQLRKNIEDIEAKAKAAEDNKNIYRIVKAIGEYWITFSDSPSIYDEAFYPIAFRKEYDPSVDYNLMNKEAWEPWERLNRFFGR